MGKLTGFKKRVATLKGRMTVLEKKVLEREGLVIKKYKHPEEKLIAEAKRLGAFSGVLEDNLRAWSVSGALNDEEQIEVALTLGELRMRIGEFEERISDRPATVFQKIFSPIQGILIGVLAIIDIIPQSLVEEGVKLITYRKE